MSRTARILVVMAFAVLMIIGALEQWRAADERRRDTSPTTLGKVPQAYGALFDLLNEVDLPVARSYSPPDALPSNATVWWLEPLTVCRERAERPSRKLALLEGAEWSGTQWVPNGGTAVLFLPHSDHGYDNQCTEVAGIPLPARFAAERADRSQPRAETIAQSVTDFMLPVRRVEAPPLLRFADAGDWTVRANVAGHPFILEHALGRGRLILVADPIFLRNAWLTGADAAPLAIDLVNAYGVPLFNEYDHGLRNRHGGLYYLATSPAVAVFIGLALIGLLVAWRGNAWPPRTVQPYAYAAPAIETFVDALAVLYARTKDYSRVLDRYRELTAARLRRYFGFAADTPLERVIDRARTRHQVSADALELLAEGSMVPSTAALCSAAQALDLLVQDATK